MTEEQLKILAVKIKEGTATEEEETEFYKNLNFLIKDFNLDLQSLLKDVEAEEKK